MSEIKYITNENGEKTDVIIPFSEYLELLEEINDLKIIAERCDEELIEHSEVASMISTYE